MTNLTDLLTKFMNTNTASTSGSGSLPSNTVANPKSDLKAIATRSGVSYNGTQSSTSASSLPKVVERDNRVTEDTVPPINNESTEDVQPPVVQVETHVPIFSPLLLSLVLRSLTRNHQFHIRLDLMTKRSKKKLIQDLYFDISFADALILMPKFASTLKSLISNKEKFVLNEARTPLKAFPPLPIWRKHLISCHLSGGKSFALWSSSTCMTLELADRSISQPIGIAEDVCVKVGKFQFPTDFVVVYFDADPRVPLILRRSFLKTRRALIDVYEEVLWFLRLIRRVGIPLLYYDLIVSTSSPTLTPFGDSDFLLEEVDAFLALEDDPTSPEVDHSYYDSEGDNSSS
ncbi:reverse transcriptase domain-containing protein [Tanacetum coccineum]